jgi:hypothetical protein
MFAKIDVSEYNPKTDGLNQMQMEAVLGNL